MENFDHILNWALKAGSHDFPGRDGGTCINEAALVAAGFDYKPIVKVDDMPACFSRPICELAMHINDQATDTQRQRLLPFVGRLACADTPLVERERHHFIVARTSGRFDFEKFMAVLGGAMAIGRRADPSVEGEIAMRFEEEKSRLPAKGPTATYWKKLVRVWQQSARSEKTFA